VAPDHHGSRGLRLEESKLRVWMSASAPLLLLALAVAVGTSGLPFWLALVLGLVAAALAWFVLYDFTTSVLVDESGVTLTSIARDRTLAWGVIERLMNPRHRGLVVITTEGAYHIVIDRKLAPEELDLVASHVRRHGIEFKQ